MCMENEQLLKQYAEYIKPDYLPTNADEYIATFRSVAALTNHVLSYLEQRDDKTSDDFQQSLEAAAHMVESLALMRGERTALLEEVKPALTDTDYQSEMYKIEDYLRHCLVQLGYRYYQ